jgi:transcriptional regulator with XRE-family HTH domain
MIDVRLDRARKLRAQGYTMPDIASRVGVHKQTIYRWLNGHTVPMGYTPQKTPVHHAAHPAVRRIFTEAAAQQCPIQDLSDKSGIGKATLHDWKRGRSCPNVGDLEAVLNVLGLTLTTKELP